ncbi:flagellar basal body rod protein FlgB [Brevundimonas sp. 2R-24]|uniref:Flagellar basal body rod protein FlgB n=1 Tax=Peiella sedimenti TaxID=3061083 RepID=A0ABT8SPR3_9CAUL|nr:flagellar basal body rod protein FlgB [Caulobacteraceae bacterium XZ-24]
MRLDDIPLFAQLRDRLSWLDQRQRVTAENVANADTPGYAARDLARPSDFAQMLNGPRAGTTLARTSTSHIAPAGRPAAAAAEVVRTPDSETTLDGNSVVLEEQMLRMAESRMAYDAAIGFYQKSLAMLRMAARPPGR